MTNPTSVEPQPRIDTLVTSAVTGSTGRRTEYSGAIWYGTPPDVSGTFVVNRTSVVRVAGPFFVPDSLPYRTDLVTSALIACSVAIASTVDESNQLTGHRASLVADPRDPGVSWLQLELTGLLHTPVAIGYRVDVLVPPEAVAAVGPAGG